MPEDENPGYDKNSKENFLYFTLPMALNYQRNSYQLWKSANQTALDIQTKDIFVPEKVIQMPMEEIQMHLTKHKLALQPNKQPMIWLQLCETFDLNFNGDVRNLFEFCDYNIQGIKNHLLKNKKSFPYLSGNKIINYWLYVITQYTDIKLTGRNHITVAPDTHVIQASVKLGLITESERNSPNLQKLVAERWDDIFKDSDYDPIDIHTPLWLWSRNGFLNI